MNSASSKFTMALSCAAVGDTAAWACPSVADIAWCARPARRLALNVALSVRGWIVSRPSNITALRKRRLTVGSGRRYTETVAGDPVRAQP